ncbi:hypothetical protein QE152_g11080 [Popillia japonica]|uniref:Uncharacterized protein n=1 Tax=Popillia japonica TaxID=7064 RepID=A0AAW1LUC0_POPJA
MKDLGEAKQYLGIEIEYNKAERKMTLSQQRYIESLAKKYGVIESKKYNTSMEMNLKLMPDFVHDYEKKGEIKVEKISTDDQLADIFTKALGQIFTGSLGAEVEL